MSALPTGARIAPWSLGLRLLAVSALVMALLVAGSIAPRGAAAAGPDDAATAPEADSDEGNDGDTGDEPGTTELTDVEAAWAAVDAAYQEMLDGTRGMEQYEKIAEASRVYLALCPEDMEHVRKAALHCSNYFRIIDRWDTQLEVWDGLLAGYPDEEIFRIWVLNQKGRALVSLDRHAEARAVADELRAIARATDDEGALIDALAYAIDVDYTALGGATDPSRHDLVELSRLAAEGEEYIVRYAGNSRFNLRPIHLIPFVHYLLNQPERTLMMANLALDAVTEDNNVRVLLLEKKGLALCALGRLDEARDVIETLGAIDDENLASIANRSAAKVEQQVLLAPGTTPPDFTLEDIREGSMVTLSELRGEIVLLDFWATWCGPCVRLMAEHLSGLHETYGERGFRLVSVGSPSRDTIEKQRAFAEEKGYHWTKLYDADREALSAYRVTAIPFVVLIDREGRVVLSGTGYQVIHRVREYLAEQLPEASGARETPGDSSTGTANAKSSED